MKLVKINVDNVHTVQAPDQVVMALGYFDGVHRGHQAVIGRAIAEAQTRGIKAAVMTFYPHPKEVLGSPDKPMRYLTPLQYKIDQLENLGVDLVYAVEFTKDFSKLTPQQFVDRFLVDLNVTHLVAGFDFTYGVKGSGTMDDLAQFAQERFTYTIVEKLSDDNEKISSTRIRNELDSGNVSEVERLLGYSYRLSGTVIHGDARGRLIGYPTANVSPTERFFIPKTGVYVVTLSLGDETFTGMANVGFKPTFVDDLPEPSIEVHIFDFDRDIYDEHVVVTFLDRIRDEQKFSGIDEIKAQLARDEQTSRVLLEQRKI
ncbi:riboflavin kinase/FMN adenylyltransferase [Alkalihalobacillus xiaoxiensis]|uniref:Riboflavin biosynthesis protein n=1 Tax=Shouchella xiaoxiensis TaxID=766895 RepID=A0ABS2SQ93_9BACI|nr:riboflavin kinase/FMN adenylyltransferase [Shouchella xiaoxiensis]